MALPALALPAISSMSGVFIRLILISTFISLTVAYLPDIIGVLSMFYSLIKYFYSIFYYIGASATAITTATNATLSSFLFLILLYLYNLVFKS